MPDVLCYDSYGNSLTHLTQWDSNIVITIKDYEYETTPIFHFSNRYSEKAIVEIGELTESGEARAKVPNELLIQPEIIKAYVFTTKESVPYKTQSLTVGQCVYKVEIPVHPRVEPDDFEYVENIEKLELSVVESHIATLVEEAEARVTRSANTAETNISNMVTAANEAVLTKLAELEQAYDDSVESLSGKVDEAIDEIDGKYDEKSTQLTQQLNAGLADIRDNLNGGSPKGMVAPDNYDDFVGNDSPYDEGIYLILGFEDETAHRYHGYDGYIVWHNPNGETEFDKLSSPLILYSAAVISENSIGYQHLTNDLKMSAVEENRTFTHTESDGEIDETAMELALAYLATSAARPGQIVKIEDGTSGKYKVYVIYTSSTSGDGLVQNTTLDKYLGFSGINAGYVLAATVQDLPASGDTDIDYYVGSSANGYVHYRYINNIYVVVGGDSYSKNDTYTKDEVDDNIADALAESNMMKLANISLSNINVPLDENDEPDTTSNAYKALGIGQIFVCVIDSEISYFIKQSNSEYKNISDTGLIFNGGRVDDEGYFHLTLNDVDVEGFSPFFIGTGGGGGTSAGINLTNVVKPSSIRNGANAIFSFTATETGDQNITVEWYVDNILIETQPDRESGSTFSFNAKGHLKNSDTSVVKAYITSAGDAQLTRTWRITSTAFSLSWGSGNPPISLHTTDTSVYATVNVSAQATAENIITVSIGEYSTSRTLFGSDSLTFELTPDKFTTGVNTITAVMASASDETDTTDPITCKVIWGYGATTPVVAFADSALSVSQYDVVDIVYYVFDPNYAEVNCSLQIGEETARSITANRTMQTLSYSPQDYGTKTVTLSYGNISTTLTLTVTQSEYNIGMVTGDNLRYNLDPVGHNNSDTDKTSFGNMTFSTGFDWTNGGFLKDDDGAAFVVKKGHRATLPRAIFEDADGNGKTIDISFKIKNSDQYDAVAMSELNNGGSKGLILKANEGELRLDNTTGQIFRYCEDNRIDLSINVESINDQRVMTVWLDGIPALANQYSANTLVQDEGNLVIGSDHCDVWIYALHIYNTSLSYKNMIQNYISLAPTTEQKVQRCQDNDIYNGNTITMSALHAARPDLTIVSISADKIPVGKGKGDYVDAVVTIQDGATILSLDSDTQYRLQGTSSLNKIRSAGNFDIDFSKTGKTYKISTDSIPVSYLNIKVNVASSENANNACAADEYNAYQTYLIPVRDNTSDDYVEGVRDTIEAKPCAVFFTNTSNGTVWAGSQQVPAGATILYAMGDICNSKKNIEVFGQDGKGTHYTKGCIEVSGNDTMAQQFRATSTYNAEEDIWQTTIVENGETKVQTDYEWRAEPLTEDKAEVIAAWDAAVAWVVSTNVATATNDDLASSVTYDGTTYTKDSAAYRLAKFKAEVGDYFAVNSLLYHFLYLEFFAALDNVSKNTFYSYDWDKTANKYLWNINKNYDDDTILGCDNDGKPIVDYGVDFGETVSGRSPFNAEGNTIWVNIRDGFFTQLASLYVERRGKGAFNAPSIIEKWDSYQAKRPHAAMAADAYNKYILPYKTTGVIVNGEEKSYDDSYLASLQGSKTYPRKQFLTYQSKYMDGKYGYFTTGSAITLRANATAGTTANLVVKAYAKTYVTLVVDNGTKVSRKIAKGETGTFNNTAVHSNATIYFTPESLIESIVPLTGTNASTFSAAGATKLVDVTLGDENSSNTAWDGNTGLSIPSGILKTFSIRNVANFSQRLDLSVNTELESVDTRGTSAGMITLPSYAPLETVNLNACSGIKAKGLNNVETFTLTNGSNLTSIYIEDCNSLINNQILSYLANAVSAGGSATRRIRLTGVNWTVSSVDTLCSIASSSKWKGYDNLGQEINTPVIEGELTINTIRQREYDLLTETFPYLIIHYRTKIEEHKIEFYNDVDDALGNKTPILSTETGEAYIQWVDAEDSTVEPIAAEYVATPIKPSTEKYNYTFSHWAYFTNNTVGAEFTFGMPISSNYKLIAVYTPSLREFTVNWYGYNSSLAEDTLLHTEQVGYGTGVNYEPDLSLKYLYKETSLSGGNKRVESKVFKQWDKSTGEVLADTNVYAVYDSTTLTAYPVTINSETKYIFSMTDELGNKKSLKDMTHAEILAILKNNQVDYNNAIYTDSNNDTQSYNYFEQKDYKDLKMGVDYTFENVVEDTLVELDNEIYLDGTNAFIPTVSVAQDGTRTADLTGQNGNPIKLFDTDKSFTMAIDFQFVNNAYGSAPAANDTLLSAIDNEGDGNDGFKLTINSSHPRLLWGSTYTKAAQNTMRDIIVLRYIADKQTLYIYSFDSSATTDGVYGNAATYSTVVRSSELVNTNVPLVIGGVATKNGSSYEVSSENQGAGIIHWCKIWYADLGDEIAKRLASWTRDDYRIEYYSDAYDYKGLSWGNYASPYYLAGANINNPSASDRGGASFIFNDTLRYLHVMNPDNYNQGGWGGYKETVSATDLTPYNSMFNFSQNRVYYGIDPMTRGFIAQVGIPSTAGNRSTTINLYNSYIYIPSYNEMFGSGSEGRVISFLSNNGSGWSPKRLYFKDILIPETSKTAAGGAKYTTAYNDANEPVYGSNSNLGLYDPDTNPNGVREGDIWQASNATGYIFITKETMKKKNITPAKPVSKNGVTYGGWVAASNVWLRSPYTGNTNNFYNVYANGSSGGNNANNTYAVLPGFTMSI